MVVKVVREQDMLREAVDVLWEHLSPAKVVRLWAAWQMGEGNYLTLKKTGFLVTRMLEKRVSPVKDTTHRTLRREKPGF